MYANMNNYYPNNFNYGNNNNMFYNPNNNNFYQRNQEQNYIMRGNIYDNQNNNYYNPVPNNQQNYVVSGGIFEEAEKMQKFQNDSNFQNNNYYYPMNNNQNNGTNNNNFIYKEEEFNTIINKNSGDNILQTYNSISFSQEKSCNDNIILRNRNNNLEKSKEKEKENEEILMSKSVSKFFDTLEGNKNLSSTQFLKEEENNEKKEKNISGFNLNCFDSVKTIDSINASLPRNIEQESDMILFKMDKKNSFSDKNDSLQMSLVMEEELPKELHEHLIIQSPLSNDTCLICSKEKNSENGRKCKICQFSICPSCVSSVVSNYYSNDMHKHPLVLESKEKYFCQACKKNSDLLNNKFCFHCKECNFSVCIKCFCPINKDN